MEQNLEAAKFVLMVCTENYRRRVMAHGTGVHWEAELIKNRICYGAPARARFIPILLPGSEPEHIPGPVRGHSHYRLATFKLTDPGFEALYRHLTDQPATPRPDLGTIKKLPPKPRPQPSPSPLPSAATGQLDVFDEQHLADVREACKEGLKKLADIPMRREDDKRERTIKDYYKFLAAMTALASANAVLDLVLAVGPPWPERNGTVTLTVALTWVGLLWSFIHWRGASKTRIKRWFSRVSLCFIPLLFIYITLNSFFVYDTTKPTYKVASGFIRRAATIRTMEKYPSMSIPELLEGAAYDPREIWEAWTVSVVEVLLLSSWILLFADLSLCFSSFLLYLEELLQSGATHGWAATSSRVE